MDSWPSDGARRPGTFSRSWLFVLAVTAALVEWIISGGAGGPHVEYDAVAYLGAADALVHTGSLRVPFSMWSDPDTTSVYAHWAPGFPILIAGPRALGLGLITSARLVQVVAAAVMVVLTAWVLARATNRATALLGVLAIAVTPAVAQQYSEILSETVFLALLVAMLAAMVYAPRAPRVYGLFAALALSTRYVGVALVGAGMLWALLQPGSVWRRLRMLALAAIPGIVVQLSMLLYAQHVHGAIRRSGYYGGWSKMAYGAAATFSRWLVPERLVASDLIAALVVLIIAVMLALAARSVVRPLRAQQQLAELPARLVLASLLLGASMFALTVLARVVADPEINLNERILLPVTFLLEIALAVLLWAWWPHASTATRSVAATLLVLWFAGSAVESAARVSVNRANGGGYHRREWIRSPLVAWLRDSAGAAPLYADLAPTIYLVAHRSARALPSAASPDTVRMLDSVLAVGNAVVVRVGNAGGYPMTRSDSLLARLALDTIARFADGALALRSRMTLDSRFVVRPAGGNASGRPRP